MSNNQESTSSNDNKITKNECICIDDPDFNDLKDYNLDTNRHEASVAGILPHPGLHLFVSVQSPIAIEHERSRKHDHFDPLEFHGHWDNVGTATFTNTGTTAQVRTQRDTLPTLMGGPLHNEYYFEQLHFHWSEDDESGCEHIFEGRAYSMEAHAVHYNSKYGSFAEAADKPDGLAVVAFFLQALDDNDNSEFRKLSDYIPNILKISSTTDVPADCMAWFEPQAHCKGYYTYQGSLTTEPYTENVTWIIYPNPITVSAEQVSIFRKLQSCHRCEKKTIKKNIRPIQQNEKDNHEIIFARAHKPIITA
ncbi:carbonic anhydrase 2 isoform X2 [Chrysoperla carnea]|uniref:carbonic anhydrase 2 isoform X2 n=1 Tax=Chrysoperla carnea TaxID=189513 RepID=UPI001D0976E1|nr:carbonic anhydrase 2 isoform X2 [Chrysoperla carnea]